MQENCCGIMHVVLDKGETNDKKIKQTQINSGVMSDEMKDYKLQCIFSQL